MQLAQDRAFAQAHVCRLCMQACTIVRCLCSYARRSCLRSVYRVLDLNMQSLRQLMPRGLSACSGQPTS